MLRPAGTAVKCRYSSGWRRHATQLRCLRHQFGATQLARLPLPRHPGSAWRSGGHRASTRDLGRRSAAVPSRRKPLQHRRTARAAGQRDGSRAHRGGWPHAGSGCPASPRRTDRSAVAAAASGRRLDPEHGRSDDLDRRCPPHRLTSRCVAVRRRRPARRWRCPPAAATAAAGHAGAAAVVRARRRAGLGRRRRRRADRCGAVALGAPAARPRLARGRRRRRRRAGPAAARRADPARAPRGAAAPDPGRRLRRLAGRARGRRGRGGAPRRAPRGACGAGGGRREAVRTPRRGARRGAPGRRWSSPACSPRCSAAPWRRRCSSRAAGAEPCRTARRCSSPGCSSPPPVRGGP